MKKLIGLLLLSVWSCGIVSGEEVCHRCEIIREENAKKPPPKYEYYEDYLKAQGSEQSTEQQPVKSSSEGK